LLPIGRECWVPEFASKGRKWAGMATCSIPLELAVYCVNCNTISDSRPHKCAVCGSEAVLRVQPILDPDPKPAATQRRALKLAYTHAVASG
jgi:hypothetical protein